MMEKIPPPLLETSDDSDREGGEEEGASGSGGLRERMVDVFGDSNGRVLVGIVVAVAAWWGMLWLGWHYGSSLRDCQMVEILGVRHQWPLTVVWWGLLVGTFGLLVVAAGVFLGWEVLWRLDPVLLGWWGAALLGGWFGWQIIEHLGWTC